VVAVFGGRASQFWVRPMQAPRHGKPLPMVQEQSSATDLQALSGDSRAGMMVLSVANNVTASELFLRGIQQIATALGRPRNEDDEPSVQAIEALRQKQEEHEEQKRRIAETIAGGAKLSRRRRP
jgi:hypothetical protein